MMASGGICPVLTCDQGIASLGMDEIWPMGETHVETIFYNIIALLVLMPPGTGLTNVMFRPD
jgi:hypothetical protein